MVVNLVLAGTAWPLKWRRERNVGEVVLHLKVLQQVPNAMEQTRSVTTTLAVGLALLNPRPVMLVRPMDIA